MKALAASLSAGLLFGVGLGVSGMTQPSKVMAFLDLADSWDPSLAFVMVGAIAVHALLFRLILRRQSPLFDGRFRLPKRTDVDAKLIGGAALFGVGWALGGFCPGPGLVSLGGLTSSAVLFVAAMTVGMRVYDLAESALSARSAQGSLTGEPTP